MLDNNKTPKKQLLTGFTLIELLVVIAIITLFSALILSNYKTGEGQIALQRSAHKLTNDLRRAQEMAISTKEVSPGVIPNGFGIHFEDSWSGYYNLFADLNGDNQRDDATEDLETIQLESGVEIIDLEPSSGFSILFVPPDPTVWIDGSQTERAQITISLLSSGATTTVSVNSAGLIEIID